MTARVGPTVRLAGGKVVLPDGLQEVDVICSDGVIAAIARPGRLATADEVIDVRGHLVFPGFIDPHVHSRDPGATAKEDFAHSTRAAAAGGVTTVLEMPNAIPPVTTAEILSTRAASHQEVAYVDFGLWGLALGEANLEDLGAMFRVGAVGVKLFWGYALDLDTKELIYNVHQVPPEAVIPPPTNGELVEIARAVAAAGGLLAVHCEDRSILDASAKRLGRPVESYDDLLEARPALAEAVSIAVLAEVSRATGCRVHVVHLGSAAGLDTVRQAIASGSPLSAETCPPYLTLTADDYAHLGVAMKVYPPVRHQRDRDALWLGVRDGTISSVGSDHAPHLVAQKSGPLGDVPAGAVGVETLGPLLVDAMLKGKVAPEVLARVLSTNTAWLYGLHPRKGAISPGADADFTIVDPEGSTLIANERLHSKQPASPWHGRALRGAITATILRGRMIVSGGELRGEPMGRFVVPGRALVAP